MSQCLFFRLTYLRFCSPISWNSSHSISAQSLSPSAESGESPVVISLRFSDDTDLKKHHDSTFECDSLAASASLSASSASSSSVTAATSVVSETAAPSFPPASRLSSSDSAASVLAPHVPAVLNHFNNASRRISATAASKPSNVVDEKENKLAFFWLRSCKLRA